MFHIIMGILLLLALVTFAGGLLWICWMAAQCEMEDDERAHDPACWEPRK